MQYKPVNIMIFAVIDLTGEFSYMGALIIEEVVKDLVTHHGMSSATKLYLAGSR